MAGKYEYRLFGNVEIPVPPSELYTALGMVLLFLPTVVVINFVVSKLINLFKPKRH